MKHTPPYYRANMTGNGQGLIIDEKTGSNIAIVYDEDDTDEIVHAVNMHEELVQALINLLAFPQNESIKDMARKAISRAERK